MAAILSIALDIASLTIWKPDHLKSDLQKSGFQMVELQIRNVCYQFRILRNLRIDIKDRLEKYSQHVLRISYRI